jgi:diguanylate cyclase (GGDEF)-like protein
MDQETVLKKVLDSDNLPILPPVASKLISLASCEETPVSDIVDLISKDIALSAKMLKLANSSFYSMSNTVSTIKQAVSIIGTNGVLSLALSFSFLRISRDKAQDAFDYEKFWEKSLASAVAAKLIKTKIDGTDLEKFFAAGLLLNIGELILARSLPEEYQHICKQISQTRQDILEVEQETLGIDHSRIGYEIAAKWGFPEFLLLPIKLHPWPETYTGSNQEIKLVIETVHVAELLSDILYSNQPQEAYQQFYDKCKTRLNFTAKDIQSILNRVVTEIENTAQFFALKIRSNKPVEEILMEANAALSVMNLNYEQMNKELIAAKIQLQKVTQELTEKNKQLEKLVHLDGLTGVYNHRFFQGFLDQEIIRSKRKQHSLSLIMADVDHFKKFNDRNGHQAGDQILKEICRLINEQLREYDILSRYGGEELAVVLPETDAENAAAVAERLRKIIADYTFVLDHEKYKVTLSFGVADLTFNREKFEKDDLIASADKALYQAKKKGRNRVCSFPIKKKWFGTA